jgi:hypothetical protein
MGGVRIVQQNRLVRWPWYAGGDRSHQPFGEGADHELLERDEDFDRSAVQSFVQAALEAEMTEATVGTGGCGGGLRRRPRSVESEVAEAWFSAATKFLVHFDPAPLTSVTAALMFTPAVHDQPTSNC